MICFKQDSFSRQWTDAFRHRAHHMRIPVSVSIELNHTCNMACCHCYLSDAQRGDIKVRSFQDIIEDIQEWVEAGCLFLLITGGEPMLHPDFVDIYRFACEQGLLVTVFSNGTVVDDAVISAFKEYAPRAVEVSIYGATPGVHDAVTGVPGSHTKAWKGIHLLREAGVRLHLKTVLLTLNRHELSAMREQAAELGVRFRFDTELFARTADGDQRPLKYRVPAEDALAADMTDPERVHQWIDSVKRARQIADEQTGRLYTCGAGSTGFHCDPQGRLAPCMLLCQKYPVERLGRAFQQVWDEELSSLLRLRKQSYVRYETSGFRGVCAHCPAANWLETGAEEKISERNLELAGMRYQMVLDRMDPPCEVPLQIEFGLAGK